MTDKMPSFKEQVNQIQIPTDKLDQIIANTVEEHAPKRKNTFKSKFIYSASVAVLAFGLLIGSAAISPAMANIVSKVPIIGSIFMESQDVGLANVSKRGFTQIIGESKQVDDKILTIEEAFYDGVRLTVSYALMTETPIEANYFSNSPAFKIDGQRYEANTYRAENEITSTFHTGLLEVKVADKLPKEFILDLVFGGRDSSKWEFKVPIQLKTSSDFIKVNHHEQVAGIDVTVTEISSGFSGLTLNYEMASVDGLPSMVGIDFHIEDLLGNEIANSHGGSGGSGNWEKFKGTASFNPLDESIEEIIITPYFTTTYGKTSNEEEILAQEQFKSFTVKLPK